MSFFMNGKGKNDHRNVTIGISPEEFRGNPFLMHIILRTFAGEKENKLIVEQLKRYNYEEDHDDPSSNADNSSNG